MKEDSELIKFFDWVRLNEKFDPRFETIYHIANERRISQHHGKILKQKGVKAGIPDVHVPIPSGMYPGLFLEFKVAPNNLSVEQKRVIKGLLRVGYLCLVVWSAEEAISVVTEYLSEPAQLIN